jgi:Tfp pilus assembly protein PilZ
VSSTKSRKDTRAVVALTARYRSPATFEYVQDACCDVSVGGMFIKSDTPAAAGTLIKLECETDSEGAKIRGVARVVWLRREPNEHGPTGMGVKFVKLESGSKDVISRLVQRLADAGIEPRSISAPPENSAAQPLARPAATSVPSAKPSAPAATTSTPAAVARAVTAESSPAIGTAVPAEATTPQPTGPLASKPAQPDVPAQAHTPAAVAPRQPAAPVDKPAIAADATSDSAAPPRSRSGSAVRVWIGVLVAVAILVAIIFADDLPNGSSLTTAPTDNPAATQAPAISPIEPSEPSAANPATEQAAADKAASAPLATAEPANEPPPAGPDAPKTPETSPSQEAAPAPNARGAAVPGPAAIVSNEQAPAPTAKPEVQYVIDFVSRPDGATITVGEQSLVTPGELNLGAMPNRVKVIATKTGYQPSSAWVDRTGFSRVDGVLRRRVYMTLPVEQPAAAPPKAARSP